MKLITIYLIFGIVLLTGQVGAVASDLPEGQDKDLRSQVEFTEIEVPDTAHVREFEKLAQEVLKTIKPSGYRRLGIDFAREGIKLGLFCALSRVLDFCEKGKHKNAELVFNALTPTPLFLLDLCICIYKKDQTLTSLQKLQKYVANLTPEQKMSISKLFKQEYANQLKNKILREKDGKGVKIERWMLRLFDIGLPLFFVVTLVLRNGIPKWKIEEPFNDVLILSFFITTVLESGLVIRNALCTTDCKKELALQKLAATFK